MVTSEDIEKVTEALDWLENYLDHNAEAQAARKAARAALSRLEAEHQRVVEACAGLAAALHKSCPECDGTRKRWTQCDYCGDSTYDHECNDRQVDCTNYVHAVADAPHPGTALLEENKRLRADSERLEQARQLLWELFDHGHAELHEVDETDSECPGDDSCRCPLVARFNAVLMGWEPTP